MPSAETMFYLGFAVYVFGAIINWHTRNTKYYEGYNAAANNVHAAWKKILDDYSTTEIRNGKIVIVIDLPDKLEGDNVIDLKKYIKRKQDK